jgi:hypothetical protein
MANYDKDIKHRRPYLRPVELRSNSLEGDVVAAGVDSEKFSETLRLTLDHLVRAEGLLDRIEDALFDEKSFSSLTSEEMLELYQAVVYRKETSQRYLARILDLASRNEILRKFFEGIKEEDGAGTQMSTVEKTAVMALRNLILDRVKKGQE